MHDNNAKLKGPSLALLRCKSKFEIFELGLLAADIKYSKFQDWPYCGANQFFEVFELGLIAGQIDFLNF